MLASSQFAKTLRAVRVRGGGDRKEVNAKQNIFLWLFCCKLRSENIKSDFYGEVLNIKGRKASSNTSTLHVPASPPSLSHSLSSMLAVHAMKEFSTRFISHELKLFQRRCSGGLLSFGSSLNVRWTEDGREADVKPTTFWMNPYQSLTPFKKRKRPERVHERKVLFRSFSAKDKKYHF